MWPLTRGAAPGWYRFPFQGKQRSGKALAPNVIPAKAGIQDAQPCEQSPGEDAVPFSGSNPRPVHAKLDSRFRGNDESGPPRDCRRLLML
jgi:hypothetical protein